MRPSTIWYTLKQGFKNIKRNWMFSLACIITMAACIFLVGIFYSIVNNVGNIAHKVEEEVPITVFFDEGTSEEEIRRSAMLFSPGRKWPGWNISPQIRHGKNINRNILEMKMRQMDLKMITLLPIHPIIRYISMILPSRQNW